MDYEKELAKCVEILKPLTDAFDISEEDVSNDILHLLKPKAANIKDLIKELSK